MIFLGGVSVDPKQVVELFTNGHLIELTMSDGNSVEVTFPSTLGYSDVIKTAQAVHQAVSLTKGDPTETCVKLVW